MKPNLVSILIPAHNAEKFIVETLKSAVNQTYDNCEIIVIDDGSTDETFRKAKRYEAKNVKIVKQENRGAAAARNIAFRIAQGDYIQWLDADDFLDSDKISAQLRTKDFDSEKLTLFSSKFRTFYYRPWKAKCTPNLLWQNLSPVEWIVTKFNNNAWMNPAVWLVSRELCEKAGPWDERLTLDDDGEYFTRVVSVSSKVKFVPEAISFYRIGNVKSLSRTKSYRACESLLLSLRQSFKHLLTLEDSTMTRQACLRYLKVWYHYFYPEKTKLIKEIDEICRSMGGSIKLPIVPKKYFILSQIIGWKHSIRAMELFSDFKILARFKYDLLMSKIDYRENSGRQNLNII